MATIHKKQIYKWTMATLAVISIALIILDFAAVININSPTNKWYWINSGILIIFAIDYFYRLFKSEDKIQFFSNNIFDLLSIIPVSVISSLMMLMNMANIGLYFRIIRLVRLAGLFGKLRHILHTDGILYVFYFSITFIMLGSIAISITEHISLDDAFWWAITTASTVGYGDISTSTISPHTLIGKIVILVMILVGVAVMGMVTSSLTAYFVRKKMWPKRDKNSDDIRLILKKLDNLEEQNKNLAQQNKKMEEQIQNLQQKHDATKWTEFKNWLEKKKGEDEENGKR